MKLVVCRRCGDVRALAATWRNCDCGASGGRYHADGLNAVIDGANALPLGFANGGFEAPIAREAEDIRLGSIRDRGHPFAAFVIPWTAPPLTRPVPYPCQQFILKGSVQGGTWEPRLPGPATRKDA